MHLIVLLSRIHVKWSNLSTFIELRQQGGPLHPFDRIPIEPNILLLDPTEIDFYSNHFRTLFYLFWIVFGSVFGFVSIFRLGHCFRCCRSFFTGEPPNQTHRTNRNNRTQKTSAELIEGRHGFVDL